MHTDISAAHYSKLTTIRKPVTPTTASCEMRIICKNLTSVHRIWFLQSCTASRTPRPVGPTAPVPGRGAGCDWPYRGLWKFDWARLGLLGLLGPGPKPCSRSEGEPRRQFRPSRCTPARGIALAEVKTVARVFSTVTGRSFKFCMCVCTVP
jgi:hypothetical protein